MNRQGNAIWKGSLQEGEGTVSTESETLTRAPYSYRARFEDGEGTNPEELIAAAHAGCFSMALASMLEKEGFRPESIDTTAILTMDPGELAITAVHLESSARVPEIEPRQFADIAEQAKNSCPVSKVLNAEISLEARLAEAYV